jgi:hypothetical protein
MSQAELQRHIDAGVTRILPINMLPSNSGPRASHDVPGEQPLDVVHQDAAQRLGAESPVLTGGMVPQSH